MTFQNPGPESHPSLDGLNEAFVEEIKIQMLEEAEKFSVGDMDNPYTTPLLLQFDKGFVELKLIDQFRDESDRLSGQPSSFVAEIITDDNGIFANQPDQQSQFLMISGASLEGTMTDDTIGVLAKDCSVSYRWAEPRTILGMNTGVGEPKPKTRYVALSHYNIDSTPLRQVIVGSDSEQQAVFSIS
ncbi:MAG: hypothetical protein U0451_03180 [Candidatus Saccharimonadales bacterium]